MDRTTKIEEYRFDEKGHKHELLVGGDWKPLLGVTTVLGVIAKPALIPWASKMACEYIKENASPILFEGDLLHYEVTGEQLEEAKNAHRHTKEKAGDWGTQVHTDIENLVVELIEAHNGILEVVTAEENTPLWHFQKWAVDNKVKFIESEKHVYSEELWIGGILDLVFEMDGKRFIGDVKTSSGIYNEAFFQMGAYDLCLKDEKVDGYLVINIRKDGKFDLKMAENREINKRAFLSALELYKITKSLK